MRRILALIALLFISSNTVLAEEALSNSITQNGITSTVVGDTSKVDLTKLEETRRIQAQQLQMIMRMNRAEDLRNAEIHKRHEGFIKNISALSAPTIEVSKTEELKTTNKKCGFWSRLFGCAQDTVVAKPAPLPNDSGTPALDDF